MQENDNIKKKFYVNNLYTKVTFQVPLILHSILNLNKQNTNLKYKKRYNTVVNQVFTEFQC